MNAIILNGFSATPAQPAEEAIVVNLLQLLKQKQIQAHQFISATMRIATCRGCFTCWVKTPGICAIKDDHEPILAKLATADLRILLTPITFGGYGYHLKKVMDRAIPILMPFFAHHQGETHHPQRYAGKRKLLVIGSDMRQDEAMNATFKQIAGRNALNMQIEAWQALTIAASASETEIRQQLELALQALEVAA